MEANYTCEELSSKSLDIMDKKMLDFSRHDV